MSDIYLELRSRIAVVAEQTVLGTQRIQDAQSAVGLSNEAVARKIPVSEKTWRRWKKAGEIPTASLPAVARALRLELHEFNPSGSGAPSSGELEAVQQGLAEIRGHLGRIEALLHERLPPEQQAAASTQQRD